MKLLVLQDWNPLRGGAERYVLELVGALREAGEEVQLLTADVSREAPAVADHLAHASDHPLAKSLLQIHNPFAAATVRRVVRSFRPQAALVNMFALYLSPAAVQALRPVPYVLLVTDYKCICPLGHRLLRDGSVCHLPRGVACLRQGCLPAPHWLRDQLRYGRIEAVVRGASAVVVPSDAVRDMLGEHGIPSRLIQLFSDAPAGESSRAPARFPLFLYLGRLDVEKGVDLLLRAFACVRNVAPDSRLRILGRGAEQPALERLAASLGLLGSVDFCGWQERERIDRELDEAWALVAPSRWPEPFGLVALEAVLRGVPAVVPDSGGFAETVQHGVTGLQFRSGEVAALAEALIGIANRALFPEHRLDPAAVSRTRERFGSKRHVAELRSVLREIVQAS